MDRKRLIVVLGMHRSGTSALTRGLIVTGATLGNSLIGPLHDNLRGFWEDSEINFLNESILSKLGSTWHAVRIIEPSELLSQDLKLEKDKAKSLLSVRLSNTHTFAFKDPRSAILLPFWQDVFRDLDIIDSYIIAIRNPVSVAASLLKRNGIVEEKSSLLWSKYILSALKYSEGKNRVVVDYDRLMQSPALQLERISKELHLSSPFSQEDKLKEYVEGFIDQDLRHNLGTFDELVSAPKMVHFAKELYKWVGRLSTDEILPDNPLLSEAIKTVEINYSNISAIYAYVDQIESERDGERSKASAAIKEQNKKGQMINKLEKHVSQSEKHVSQLEMHVSQKDKQILQQSNEIINLENCLSQISATLSERDAQLTTLVDKTNEMVNSTSWRITAPVRWTKSILLLIGNSSKRFLSHILRYTWNKLPVHPRNKYRIKYYLFRFLPFFFRHTKAFHHWHDFEKSESASVKKHSVAEQASHLKKNHEMSPYVPLLEDKPIENALVRLIAFYLPQFHTIPENDKWWGKGFTEWTNVRKATPQFEAHYQPNMPGELGYYDLRDNLVQKRQVELAKLYGIGGFCFYFYWFGGRRLLEEPILNYHNTPSLDLPFCLCWANENWSRRWDGLDNHILIKQNHSPTDDIEFIKYTSRYLKDPRYLRIKNMPILLVYRPDLLPSPVDTTERWRNWCREQDIGEIYLICTQSFEKTNPKEYGFDAAVEFPPNNSSPPIITNQVVKGDNCFSGTVYDWSIFLRRSKHYQQPTYTLFRGVNTAWDNTPRRNSESTIFYNSSPVSYKNWLINAMQDTLKNRKEPSSHLVFINAWNEWAEGAYLEPDQRYGYAYLQATRDGLIKISQTQEWRRIMLVGHDAYPHGAQTLMLFMLKTLVTQFGFEVDLLLLGNGPMVTDYEKYAKVYILGSDTTVDRKGKELAEKLYLDGVRQAITNTTVCGEFVAILKQEGFNVVSLIHELPGIISQFQLNDCVKKITQYADKIVFPAQQIKNGFEQHQPIDPAKVVIRPQGLYKKNSLLSSEKRKKARIDLRKRFGIPSTSKIVLGVGFADYRKGIDLFVKIAAEIQSMMDGLYFIWVGKIDGNILHEIEDFIKINGLMDCVIFPGYQNDTDIYYAGADIFALTSREDPYPTVVMEAMDSYLPIVAFEGTSGACKLIKSVGGLLVAQFNVNSYTKAIADLSQHPAKTYKIGSAGRLLMKREYSFRQYVIDLLGLGSNPIMKISIIIPNYNYAHYLTERITSIINQTYPVWELIILDDASTDDSVNLINSLLKKISIQNRIVVNKSNSGNVFRQWRKGVQLATGDYVWIAEADDLSDPTFLERTARVFNDPDVVLSYCESKQIGLDGKILCNNYQDYVSDMSKDKWSKDYVEDGLHEISNYLSIKNSIPNVSAVLFKREILQTVLDRFYREIINYKVAGDWVTYIYTLNHGKIAFTAQALNYHRRHEKSITISSFDIKQLLEIVRVQKLIQNKFIVDAQTIDKATNYAQKIYEQFGINSDEYPLIINHPEFNRYFKNENSELP